MRTVRCFSRVLILLAAVLVGCNRTTRSLSGVLPVHAPSMAAAGEAITVTIGPVTAANGTPVGLVLVGIYGPRIYQTAFESGMAHITIPSDDTYQPGYVALIAAAEQARGEASIMLVSPGAAAWYESYELVDSRQW